MSKYIPSPRDWVREQVELYESSGGTKGTTLRDTGLPVIIVTHTGNKTGAIRKTPLMRVKDGDAVRSRRFAGRSAGRSGLGPQPARQSADRAARRDGPTPDARARGQATRRSGPVCGRWPSRRIRRTPTIRPAPQRQIPVFVAEP